MKIKTTETRPVEYPLLNEDGSLPFGKWENRAPHGIFSIWTPEKGWGEPEIDSLEKVLITPFSNGVQYARLVFEGMKAFPYGEDGVRLFRPGENARRISRSARGMVLPELPEEMFSEALNAIVDYDREWLPRQIEGGTLYIRPFVLDVTKGVGVGKVEKSMKEVMFGIGLFPSGPYFSGGLKPISLTIDQYHTRSSPGGNSDKKWGGNYGGAYPAMENSSNPIVFCDPCDHETILEGSVFNIFFVYKNSWTYNVVTPALNGQILSGITRDTVLRVSPDMTVDGLPVAVDERTLKVPEILEYIITGKIVGAAVTGTAAVVTPVDKIVIKGREHTLDMTDPFVGALREKITGIQFGRVPDDYGFMVEVPRRFLGHKRFK